MGKSILIREKHDKSMATEGVHLTDQSKTVVRTSSCRSAMWRRLERTFVDTMD
jgi:hypothetical protein